MQASKLITKTDLAEIKDGACEVCTLHHRAKLELPDEVLCPHCKEPISDSNFELEVVGEVNYYDPEDNHDQNIEKLLLKKCEHCRKYVALKPIPIIYHGGHDIFYTGGKDYVVGFDHTQIEKAISPSIKQYLERFMNVALKEKEKGFDEQGDYTTKPMSIEEFLTRSVPPNILEFTEEDQSSLNVHNLCTWITSAIEDLIASELYKAKEKY